MIIITHPERGLVAFPAGGGSLEIKPNGDGATLKTNDLSHRQQSAANAALTAAQASDWLQAQRILEAAGFSVGVK